MAAQRFAHAAEAEVAGLLTFYGLAWEYEPHAFPIAWDEDGVPTEFLRPDFHVPDLGLWIEVTVLHSRNACDKHRKVRLFRGAYPGLRLVLIGRQDVRRMLIKEGRGADLGLVLGPAGQTT